MKKLILLSILSGLLLFSCQENPNSGNDTLEIDPVVAEQAPFGFELNGIVSTGSDIEGLTQTSQYLEEEGVDDFSNIGLLKGRGLQLMQEAKTYLPLTKGLHKATGDSLFFYFDDTTAGIRIALSYNSESNIARIYEVKYKFASWRNITYDSAEVVIDVGPDLDDDSDDIFKSLNQLQLFKEQYFVQSIVSDLEVTDYTEGEVSGVEATIDSYYHPDRFLAHLRQYIKLEPDQSGTLREDFDFNDGTSSFRSVTFHEDFTGEFSKQLRDGTLISGTFDSVEDDLEGYYTETTDFPEGRYLDKIIKEAIVAITLPDSIFYAEYSETVHFSSGRIDSSNISIEVSDIDGTKTTHLTVLKPNGAHGSLTVVEMESESTLEGEWTTWNDYFIIVSAEYYFDGSGHVHYEVYAPPYSPGDTPLIVADYYFSPDESGNGVLMYKGEAYQITFNDGAEAEITKDGKSTVINLYQ